MFSISIMSSGQICAVQAHALHFNHLTYQHYPYFVYLLIMAAVVIEHYASIPGLHRPPTSHDLSSSLAMLTPQFFNLASTYADELPTL